MRNPLVTVICLCYNHARFVQEAIESVMKQTYSPIQLIVVDDGSTDESRVVIREVLRKYPEVVFFPLDKNLGNCRAFNKGFALAKGEYIIDLAADDQLEPTRVDEGVDALEAAGANFGVSFSDAELIDADGKHLGFHSDRFPHDSIPQGDIYASLINRYFINSPTMMIRREVLDVLHGYDESLAYEDFDFWIRSSRLFHYCYSERPLVKRRIVRGSMARVQFKRNSRQRISTYKICQKIKRLNRTPEENGALRKRIFYEIRKSVELGEVGLVARYIKLLF